MTREERAFYRIQELGQEIVKSKGIIEEIYSEKERLHDFYMENCLADGKKVENELNRLERLYYKHMKNIEKNEKEIYKLRIKYNI